MEKRTYKPPHTYKCRVLNPPIHSTNQLATVQFSCTPGFVGNPYLGHCEGKFVVNFIIFLFSLALYFLLHRFFLNFLPLHGVKINYVTLCDMWERKRWSWECGCICILYHLRNDNCLGVRILAFFLISSLSLSVHNCLTFVGQNIYFFYFLKYWSSSHDFNKLVIKAKMHAKITYIFWSFNVWDYEFIRKTYSWY